jgi:hypothetical protein
MRKVVCWEPRFSHFTKRPCGGGLGGADVAVEDVSAAPTIHPPQKGLQ